MKSARGFSPVNERCRESGQVLAITLAMFALGSVILVPALGLAASSLGYHRVVEKNLMEVYAADSGVEYGLCRLGNDPTSFETTPLNETITVNGCNVSITVQFVSGSTYLITSTASSSGGSNTTVQSYASFPSDFSHLFDSAITSPGDVTLKPGSEVTGDVKYSGVLDNKGEIYGDAIFADPLDWPTASELTTYYLQDVAGLTPFPNSYIDIKNTSAIGPLYREGSLTIKNTDSIPHSVTLFDTIYVTGDLIIGQGGQSFTINLNGQTLFAGGNIEIKPDCIIQGSGCIIAVGNVSFQPQAASDPSSYVFVLSSTGTIDLKPGTSFYGSVCGDCEVELYPGTSLEWTAPAEGLNFPLGGGFSGSSSGLNIHTWKISK